MEKEYCVEMQSISKHFGGVQALKNVDFRLRRGEVRALLGENGAGKSTLMKILAGAVSADSGIIKIDGKPATIRSPKDSRDLGVSIIYQEFVLAPQLSVAENIFLDRLSEKSGIVNWKKINAAAKKLLMEMGFDMIDPRKQVGSMPVAYQQIVEICKSLSQDAHILILDEPTAVLTFGEIERLFGIVKKLKDCGWGIIYISHKMPEIKRISDEITIMRDGQWIATRPAAELEVNDIIRLMVGRELNNQFPPKTNKPGAPFLEVRNLSGMYNQLRDISFTARRGEIVGLAGLDGSGRTETLETMFGFATRKSGVITLDGKVCKNRTPRQSIKNHFALLTEERRATGIFGIRSIRDNTVISSLKKHEKFGFVLSSKSMKKDTQWSIDAMHTKTPSQETKIRSLSGGNQQKVIIGRWLLTDPDVLLLDEPTRGIDVGAKYEIYQLILDQANRGKTVLMVSSEMPELLGVCDRILVMSGGRLAGEVDAKTTTQEEIMRLAAKYV